MRVCLISPGHLTTNPRLVKEARALVDAGHDVSVVCGRYIDWAWAMDKTLVDPRWTVTHVPFGPTEAPQWIYVLQTVRREAARALARAGMSSCTIFEAAQGPPVRALGCAAAAVPADLYIARYVAGLPAAARAARIRHAAYAFDAEDFHLGDLPDAPEHAFEKATIRTIEHRYLPGTAYVTAASPMIADAYADTYDIRRPKVVLNVFPRSNGPPSPTPGGTATPGPSLYWFSQTIGAGRGLETAVEAISIATSAPHLYLRGTAAVGYADKLSRLARQYGVEERLHIMGPETPDEMERLGSHYDLGYVGEHAETVNRRIALTNKLFSYLVGGVPIVATDIPAHQLIEPQLGEAMTLFPIGNASALAAALDRILMDPDRLARARAHAWHLGQKRYCWEVEKKAFLEAVDTAVSGPGNAN